MRFFRILLLGLVACYQTPALANIDNYFNTIKKNPNALFAFLKSMPKGGELHYHLAGGAYPEAMLSVVAKENYCLNKNTYNLTKIVEDCRGVLIQQVMTQPDFYEKTIEAWSMKNFHPLQESGHDHFFNSFFKFLPIVVNHSPELLAEVMQRAANQQEQYMEVMIAPDNMNSIGFGTSNLLATSPTHAKEQLLANADFQNNIHETVNETTNLLKKARQLLSCDKKPEQQVCQLTVKFQYIVLREQPLEKVFAQALNGFAAASQSQELIAINLVQPEDGLISLHDYHKQMEIFAFLHQAYPNVHLSLHAGELEPEAVAPSSLNFHMNEAINIAHAQRIGHGTAVAYEDNAQQLLQQMAKRQIAVEINLTSNHKILNIHGKKHPLRYYLANNVPVVLSTDDEGILRTDLTREYVKAVLEHKLDYPTLKQINRNALSYSFLSGKSLWLDPAKAKPVKACQNLHSTSCLAFIKTSEKAKLQWQLEDKLNQFEIRYAK
ncbi:adenosine deaminase family protein [Legionella hackeliae]|uniref:adenosine deaminase n=1 Tax=Legionella hackeliae TaxID=449 RepID=A0A0A8ULG2_LEGHA|nr:adenosine deaminase [Legionella hackeliae]KTD10195.1 adenosine deaminase [Legionella hackeliae]CEK09690.1 Adenosine deaminase [Legionella hackeliae]STX49600.1 adenosine deaminase [Legionella hackeliae]